MTFRFRAAVTGLALTAVSLTGCSVTIDSEPLPQTAQSEATTSPSPSTGATASTPASTPPSPQSSLTASPSTGTSSAPAVAPDGVPAAWAQNWCEARQQTTLDEVVNLMGKPTAVKDHDAAGTEHVWQAQFDAGVLYLSVGVDLKGNRLQSTSSTVGIPETAKAPFACEPIQ